jgi:hypothetical protein
MARAGGQCGLWGASAGWGGVSQIGKETGPPPHMNYSTIKNKIKIVEYC